MTDLTFAEAVSLYEDAPCGYATLTLDGTIVRSNRTFVSWMEVGKLEGQAFGDLLTAPSKLLYGTYYSSLLQTQGAVGDLALELGRCGKPPLAVMITSRIVTGTEGRSSHISLTLFDITERRRYERQLLAAKRKADTLADVVRFSETAILTISFDFELETWNKAAQDLFGASVNEVSSLHELLPQLCLDRLTCSLETSSPVVFEHQLSINTVTRITAYPLSNGMAVFLADITQERASRIALQQAHERFSLATMATSDGIWDLDCATGALYTSARVQAMLGLEEREVTQGLEDWLQRIHPEDIPAFRATQAVHQDSPGKRFESEYRFRHQDQSWRWLHSRGMPLLGADGSLARMLGSVTDVTSRKRKDPLTGLHTRLALLEVLEGYVRAGAVTEHSVAVFFIDLDSFKNVNAGFNNNVGDRVLVAVAQRLRVFLRNVPKSVAARARADEFVVLMNGVSAPELLWSTAQRLHTALERPLLTGDQQVRISVSIGIAVPGPTPNSSEEMLRNADLAMHRAKAEGPGGTVLFADAMRHALSERMALEADLYQALRAEGLLLFYQPKVDLKTESIIGFEALGRWYHPTRGMVPPDTFIGIAEESNLICEIGRWTIRTAVRQLADWRREGKVPSSTTMSVNLSPKQFNDPELVSFLRTELNISDVPASCFSLEITEGVLIGDSDQACRILAELKEIGVGLDLDDFGKGYSSLSYLDRYPFDTLKIDRAFISRLGGVDDSSTITRSIVALGHALDLKIVAEGIETRDQLESLLAMGCGYGQGYLFAKPLHSREIVKLLKGQPALGSAAA